MIAITEGKQKDLVVGFMQNVMQLESSYHTNTRKRKASVTYDDEFDYLYGIVTTGIFCHFSLRLVLPHVREDLLLKNQISHVLTGYFRNAVC